MAQSVGPLTLDFGSGHDLRFVGSGPASGSAKTVQILLGILSLSLSLSLPPSLCPSLLALSLSLKINKLLKNNVFKRKTRRDGG